MDLTMKHKTDSSIERLNARLVTKGFTQTYGVDYQEAFAPIAKMNSIRIETFANLKWISSCRPGRRSVYGDPTWVW